MYDMDTKGQIVMKMWGNYSNREWTNKTEVKARVNESLRIVSQ